ncbi:unnamed protein product, partial [Mesorhabditis belari]|uniref:Uncharacterized protein n=1 Tax=Mesorhabditis belari TaxID=2138241 RepID=A0AAF3F9K1_9BILA
MDGETGYDEVKIHDGSLSPEEIEARQLEGEIEKKMRATFGDEAIDSVSPLSLHAFRSSTEIPTRRRNRMVARMNRPYFPDPLFLSPLKDRAAHMRAEMESLIGRFGGLCDEARDLITDLNKDVVLKAVDQMMHKDYSDSLYKRKP